MLHSESLERLIPKTYVHQGLQNIQSRVNLIEELLQKQTLPLQGWDEPTIEMLLEQLSAMDSNNFAANAGVGEREGRVFSSMVAKRHYHMSHGIGRSGDLVEVQPKAAGSSIMYKLANKMTTKAVHIAGMHKSVSCIVFPLATGMTLSMAMSTLRQQHPEKRYVLWSRIDQKSCFKSIFASGLVPIVVENEFVDGELRTGVNEMELILQARHQEILCVLSTTSCFAPRQPDEVDRIAELCAKYDVGHVINNAYGLQCQSISKRINRAFVKGRVDCIVQSTDKNFLVPVGGAIVASTNAAFLQRISGSYPGRASAASIMDLFITLLSMGEQGYRQLLSERARLLPIFEDKLRMMAEEYNLSLISSPQNHISFALSLDRLPTPNKGLTFLGSMLFQRNVSGCRVVSVGNATPTTIAGIEFMNWGSHHNAYPHSYFTAACAIGMVEPEIDLFIERLGKTLQKFMKLNST